MPVLKKIKNKFRNYFLRKVFKKVKRHKNVVNYYEANSIGILYDASIEDNYLYIIDLARQLQQDGKTVSTLGFVKQKKKPHYSYSKSVFGFFFKNDFSWNYKSKSLYIDKFVDSKYDILIDLSPAKGFFFNKIIATNSKAMYKAGLYNSDLYYIYDLLIDVDKKCSIENLVKHYFHYLKTIKNKETYA